MVNRWGNNDRLYLFNTVDGDCSHKIETHLLLRRKAMTNLDNILKKQRHYFADKGPYTQSYGFSISHVWMWELNNKKVWAPKNWCFWTVVLEKTLESHLDCKEIKPVNPKGNEPWILNAEYWILMLKLKLKYFGHLLRKANSLEKTLLLGKIEGRKRRGQWRMRWLDGTINSMDMNLSKLQEIVKDRKAWGALAHRVIKSWTQISDWTTHFPLNEPGTSYTPVSMSSFSA